MADETNALFDANKVLLTKTDVAITDKVTPVPIERR